MDDLQVGQTRDRQSADSRPTAAVLAVPLHRMIGMTISVWGMAALAIWGGIHWFVSGGPPREAAIMASAGYAAIWVPLLLLWAATLWEFSNERQRSHK